MIYKGLFLGLTSIDIQYFVDKFPAVNKKVKTKAPDVLVGGPATNAAVAFSYLNNGAHLVSVAGEGAFASFILNDFSENNIVNINLGDEKTKPVIASVVTSSNGDRNIFTHHPERQKGKFNAVELFDNIKPEIVLTDGFYPEFGIQLASEAARRNIPVVLDCGSWKPQYSDLLKYANTAICSADFMPPFCNAYNQVFEFLKKAGVENRAITRGAESILFEHENTPGEIAVNSKKIVDTLGAGDFIHGSFCFYYLKMKDFERALTAASQLASFTCRFNGTREWLKYKKVVNV